jgi:hypothetical protein
VIAAAIIVVVLVVVIPVGVMVSGAAASAILGSTLAADGAARHEGSELLELNR